MTVTHDNRQACLSIQYDDDQPRTTTCSVDEDSNLKTQKITTPVNSHSSAILERISCVVSLEKRGNIFLHVALSLCVCRTQRQNRIEDLRRCSLSGTRHHSSDNKVPGR
jgi:hypothetical protein